MFKNNRKFTNAIVIAAALAMPTSFIQYCQPSYVLATDNSAQTPDANRTVSVQKLYANVYDQETGQFLGRYLLDIENGYTDSPHRMFSYSQLPQINGYGYIANAPMVSVDWTNPSGITDMKVYVVKKSSPLYKQTYGDSSSSQSSDHHTTQHQSEHNRNSAASSATKKSSSSANSSSSKNASSQTAESSSSSASDQSAKAKSKAKKNAKAKTKSASKQTKQKSNVPAILIGGVVLIIAIAAIVWGIIKMRKPRKHYKHQK